MFCVWEEKHSECVCVCKEEDDESEEEDILLNVERKSRRSSRRPDHSLPDPVTSRLLVFCFRTAASSLLTCLSDSHVCSRAPFLGSCSGARNHWALTFSVKTALYFSLLYHIRGFAIGDAAGSEREREREHFQYVNARAASASPLSISLSCSLSPLPPLFFSHFLSFFLSLSLFSLLTTPPLPLPPTIMNDFLLWKAIPRDPKPLIADTLSVFPSLESSDRRMSSLHTAVDRYDEAVSTDQVQFKVDLVSSTGWRELMCPATCLTLTCLPQFYKRVHVPVKTTEPHQTPSLSRTPEKKVLYISDWFIYL